jgi:murein DD-endopeptidase MepM/ murein hydrolase activator NlpD
MAEKAGVATPEEPFPLAHVGEEADPPGPVPAGEVKGTRLARSLAQLLREVDARWPGRDSGSDRVERDRGVVRALDIGAGGIRADLLVEYLRQLAVNGDPRLVNGGCVVFNHRIASEIGSWHWRVYTGEDPHTSHIHVTVSLDPAGYDAGDGWGIAAVDEEAPPEQPVPTLPPAPAVPPVPTEPPGAAPNGASAAAGGAETPLAPPPKFDGAGPASTAATKAAPAVAAPPAAVAATPATLDRRFDVLWFGGNHPLSEEVFDILRRGQSAVGRGHYIALPSTRRRADVEAAGNAVAHYDNASLASATRGAAGQGAWRQPGHLDAVVDSILAHRLQQAFTTPWIFLNEISASVWGREPGYRRWVVALVQRLAEGALRPVVFSPFKGPTRGLDEWRELGRLGFIAIEGYLDSERIASLPPAQRARHCRGEYEKMLEAYRRQGVRSERLFLTEHFGHTKRGMPGGPRGRWGLGGDEWADVIRARSEAAATLPFGGHVTFAWMYNWIGEADLAKFAAAYVRSVTAAGLGGGNAALSPKVTKTTPQARKRAGALPDADLVGVMRTNGIVQPELTLRVAREVGLGLAIACSMLEKESGGGRNVYGHDKVRNPVKSPPGRLLEVTQENYAQYKRHRNAGLGAQGVGPTQLTFPPLQDRADEVGGCWNPEANLRVGFTHLRDLVRRNGIALGGAVYNGGPRPNADARAYGADLQRRVLIWRGRFGVAQAPRDPAVVNDTRTFVVGTPLMTGIDVRRWQETLKRQLDLWKVDYPLAIDDDYGAITRDATLTVLFGLGIDKALMKNGLTPQLRAKVRNDELTAVERTRKAARGKWRAQLRERFARSARLGPPIAQILNAANDWAGSAHDGVDLICKANAPIFAICDAEVIDVRADGWWGKSAPRDPTVRARGDGIIQLRCLVDAGPFRRGLHFGYGHAEHATVRVGQVVRGGQQIGRAGMANAWHIHFMVNRGGHRRGIGDHDPMPYVRHASRHE